MSFKEPIAMPRIGTLVLILVLIAGTFPELDWSFGPGDDPPLAWVFNSLFAKQSVLSAHFIFPHGPLAFFLYPTPEHALLVLLVIGALKATMLIGFASLTDARNASLSYGIAFAVSYAISVVANFELLVLTNVLVFCYIYIRKANKPAIVYAILLAAFAFFVKAYVAIISLALLASCALVMLKSKKWQHTIVIGTCFVLTVLLIRLSIYGSFEGFEDQLLGLVQLAGDNSSAVSFYPHLSVAVPLMILLLVGFYSGTTRGDKGMYALLSLPALFAAWKHGMARADVFHQKGFFVFVIICMLAHTLTVRKKWLGNGAMTGLVLYCIILALPHSYNYQEPQYRILRFDNFGDAIFSFAAFQEAALIETQERISVNVLSNEMQSRIGDASIDVYPWDLSYIPANKLNWQPRRVIQSYAAYTPWLDQKNAAHFSSEQAPEFVLWHKTVGGLNLNAADLNSIDGRYLLNDEPQTLTELQRRYELVEEDDKVKLYQRRATMRNPVLDRRKEQDLQWNRWIDVPNENQSITKVQFDFERSFGDKIRSFLFKDAQFWMLLRDASGSIYKYRVVPKNAQDGLWVSPILVGEYSAVNIQSIQFTSSSNATESLNLEWEFTTDDDMLESFFGAVGITDSLIGESKTQSLYKQKEKFIPKSDSIYNREFTPPLELNLDALQAGEYILQLDAWIKARSYQKNRSLSLVIDVEDVLWKSMAIDEQCINRRRFVHVQHHVRIRIDKNSTGVKGYIHNPHKLNYEFYDLRLRLLKRSE